jgi:hypothetical protein
VNAQTKIKTDDAVAVFAEAFVKLQAAIRPAIKDATNPAFRSKYADLGAVWEAVKQPLTDNGFSVIQSPDFDGDTMWLRTTILHVSGERVEGRYPLRPVKQDPQGFGSALTYARRYSLSAMLGVVADDDDDGNAASAPNGNGHATPRSATRVSEGMEADIEEGVKNWREQAIARFPKIATLPALWDWKDTNQPALDRLEKKHKASFDAVMQAYQRRHHEIGSQEKA